MDLWNQKGFFPFFSLETSETKAFVLFLCFFPHLKHQKKSKKYFWELKIFPEKAQQGTKLQCREPLTLEVLLCFYTQEKHEKTNAVLLLLPHEALEKQTENPFWK